MHGRQAIVALGGEAHLEDDAVVDVDAILDLQIVQVKVAHLLSVADADEEQGHSHLPGVLGDLDQILALGGDAVGEHDDGGQRRAAEVVEHLAHGHPELAGVVLLVGAEAVDRLQRRLDIGEGGHVRETMGAAGAMINVDADFTLRQEGGDPVRFASCNQRSGEREAIGVRQVVELREAVGGLLDARVLVGIDGGHAL